MDDPTAEQRPLVVAHVWPPGTRDVAALPPDGALVVPEGCVVPPAAPLPLRYRDLAGLVAALRGVRCDVALVHGEGLWAWGALAAALAGAPVVVRAERRAGGRRLARALDVAGASAGLLLGAPLFVAIAAAVRWRLGAPVLFRQRRPGLYGAIFELVKFRSMTDARGADGELLPDGERLTAFGAWLRRTSLDELPTLLNVLRGEMSLVGPRPLLVQYLARYSPPQARRHEVPPGVTGWAQIHGRNALDWDDKLALDVWYVDHRSLWLDLQILWRTVASLRSQRGIAAEGHATMPEFMGPAR